MKTELNPMIYGDNSLGLGGSLLYFEQKDGFEIAIVNVRGSHPCAYVNVPKSFLEKYEKQPELDFNSWYADGAHGGFTYAEKEPPVCVRVFSPGEGFWLGWDYAHCDDYTAIFDYYGNVLNRNSDEKKWTTEEILEHAYSVINTLEYDDSEFDFGEESQY